MKKIIFLKGMLSVVMLFIASLTISAAKRVTTWFTTLKK